MPQHDLLLNPNATPDAAYGREQAAILNSTGLSEAHNIISAWPGYAPTPLRDLPGLSANTGVAAIHYKDENYRFDLKSFKPLGGAYAVARLLMDKLPEMLDVEKINITELLTGRHSKACSKLTVTAATDGNHGRAVAWSAQMFGCKCVIFINAAVSKGREQAISDLGAEVRRTSGSFDDAVRISQETADKENWHVIADTTAGIFNPSANYVTQGYAVMAAETIAQLPNGTRPSHMFLQAGVGGMAAATCGQFWQAFGPDRPRVIIVEPYNAACWFESLRFGQPTSITGNIDSLMCGLACGEISELAWKILKPGAHAAMKVADKVAANTMCQLASGVGNDEPIVAGESGVAGLAGFLSIAEHEDSRRLLEIDHTSRIVVFGTEGATDPDTYKHIVELHPDEVIAGKRSSMT